MSIYFDEGDVYVCPVCHAGYLTAKERKICEGTHNGGY